MCPKVMDYIKNLVQHDRVVEDFKLNILVLKKMRFHSEMKIATIESSVFLISGRFQN
jgi:hypothetical protein